MYDDNRIRSFLVLALIAALCFAPAAFAQSSDDAETDTSVSGSVSEDGIELSFDVDHDEGDENAAAAPTAGSGPWYQNPVTVSIIGLALLVILILSILAFRGSRQPSSARS